jgi:bla regulator protein blaR1
MTGLSADTIIAFVRSAEFAIVAKATVVVVLGLTVVRVGRRARASLRHLVLAATFGGLLALPFVPFLSPPIAIEIPNVSSEPLSAPADRSRAESSAGPVDGGVTRGASISGPRSFPATWSQLIQAAWVTGAVLVLGSLGVALWQLIRIRRSGLPWLEARPIVGALAAEAGLRRPVEILLHESIPAPFTCGLRHPAIVVPADARDWSDADIRRTLIHELEHIRRGDWAVQVMSRAACAVYWFHPLVWSAWRRLRLEAERACDDAVLQSAECTDYAEQLVQLARRISAAPAPAMLGMATRGDLSARVSALLDGSQRRGRAGLFSVAAALAGAAVIVLAIAPLRAIGVSTDGNAGLASQPAAAGSKVEGLRARALDEALYEAAEGDDLAEIGELLAAGANVNAAIEGDGSPLIAASRKGRVDVARLLLERGADPDMPVPGDGNPIIMAAREGHEDVVRLLLDRGANIDKVVPGDENALIQASGEGHLRVVKLLVSRGADVNARVWIEPAHERPDGEWRTPLSMARKEGHATVVNFLLEAGARE